MRCCAPGDVLFSFFSLFFPLCVTEQYNGTIDCFVKIIKKEGVGGCVDNFFSLFVKKVGVGRVRILYIQREGVEGCEHIHFFMRTHSSTCAMGGAEMIFTLSPLPPPLSPLSPLSLPLCRCFLRL